MERRTGDSFRLYARPSFFEGIARLFDFGGSLNKYNSSDSGEKADYKALKSDWSTVGEDIYSAINVFSNDLEKQHE